MSDGPLPHRVNIRKAVTRSARYAGTAGIEQIPRFASLLRDGNAVSAEVLFGVDEEGQAIATVSMEAPVVLECQRCLGPLKTTLRSESTLGLVYDDEQARHLPGRYEPWIAVEEIDLWDVVAEELALALPVVSYHDDDKCSALPQEAVAPDPQLPKGADRDNPFNVLSSLLEKGDAKEK